MRFRSAIVFMLMLILWGCVGTVQDAKTPLTQIAAKPKGNVTFSGIYQANAISQDKIEVFFYPASGGTQKFYYLFYVGDKPIPYSAPSEILAPDYRGLLKFTITGLEPAKTYVIKAEAVDASTLDKDQNTVTATVTTFDNLVADFNGIVGVYNTAGIDGIDSINVRWSHARINYSSISNSATDPKSYEIVAIDSSKLGIADMDKPDFGPQQGRYVKIVDYDAQVNEAVVRGLKSATKYFVRVRAIHQGSVEDPNNPNLRSEKNTNYMSIETLNAELSSILNLDSLKVLKNGGISQSTSLLLNWNTITGVFEHLRVYYTRVPAPIDIDASISQELCEVNPDEAQTSCRKIYGSGLSTVIANLSSGEVYSVQLVACQNAECTVRRVGPVKQGTTNPSFAGFSGISSIGTATNVGQIGKVFLQIPLPDFSEGDIDGFIIGYKTNNGATYEEISEASYTGLLKVERYDYRTETSITISNVDYSGSTLHYFTVYPFIYNSIGEKNKLINNVWKSVKVEIEAPTKYQFAGFSQVQSEGTQINLRWTPPISGIFDQYEIYVRTTPGQFTFSEAKSNTTDYVQIILPWYLDRYTLTNLEFPQNYKVGILTRFLYGASNLIYSEDNDNTFVCYVDNASSGGIPVMKACDVGI